MGHLLTVAKMTMHGQEMRNTYWWGGDDAVHANAQVIIDEIADAYRDELAPELADAWQLYAFDVYDKTVPSSPGIEYLPAGAAIVGIVGAQTVATQVAVRIDIKASVPKPNTNRKYIPGWPEGTMGGGGLWDAANITACADFAQRLLDLPTTITKAVVIEVVHLSDVDGTVVASNPLTYYKISTNPSTLRRRKIGVGI